MSPPVLPTGVDVRAASYARHDINAKMTQRQETLTQVCLDVPSPPLSFFRALVFFFFAKSTRYGLLRASFFSLFVPRAENIMSRLLADHGALFRPVRVCEPIR